MSKAADNVVIFDNRGIPSVMVRFERPQDTAEIPAMFKIGDMVADAIYISKYDGVEIADLKVELSEIPQVLRDLGIIPKKRLDSENATYVWFDATEGEWLPIRGSAFINTSFSGPSALSLFYVRSYSIVNVGFRSAFYEVNGKLITE